MQASNECREERAMMMRMYGIVSSLKNARAFA